MSADRRPVAKITLEVIRKPADQQGFAAHPTRWVVERTLAWLTACRRLARDYGRHPEVSEDIIRWAAIASMTRRITRGGPARPQARQTFTTPRRIAERRRAGRGATRATR